MSGHHEIVLSVLLDNLVGSFLSRFRSRRVGGTTCYLPVYEPILNKVLRFADRIISRTPIRDDGLARLRVMKHEVVFRGKFVVHFKIFQITDVIILTFSQVFMNTLAVEVVVGSVRQSSVFVLDDRLDVFVFLIDITLEAFSDVGAQVSAEGICWSIRIDVVSEIMLLEHRIQGVARGSVDVVERLTSIHYYYGENLIGDSRGLAVGLNVQGILLFDESLDGLGNRGVWV